MADPNHIPYTIYLKIKSTSFMESVK